MLSILKMELIVVTESYSPQSLTYLLSSPLQKKNLSLTVSFRLESLGPPTLFFFLQLFWLSWVLCISIINFRIGLSIFAKKQKQNPAGF